MKEPSNNQVIFVRFILIIFALFCIAFIYFLSKVEIVQHVQCDKQYKNYCDSIWYTDKNYYLNVLVETDEYQQYIQEHGEWWNE